MYKVDMNTREVSCETLDEVRALVGTPVVEAEVVEKRPYRRRRKVTNGKGVPLDGLEFATLAEMRRNGEYLTTKQKTRLCNTLGPVVIAEKLMEGPITSGQIKYMMGARSAKCASSLGLHYRKAARELQIAVSEVFLVEKGRGSSTWHAKARMPDVVKYLKERDDA